MRHRAPDWALLLASSDAPEPPPVPMALRVRAAVPTAHALRMLRKQGWGPAHRYLQQLHPVPGSDRYAALPPLEEFVLPGGNRAVVFDLTPIIAAQFSKNSERRIS